MPCFFKKGEKLTSVTGSATFPTILLAFTNTSLPLKSVISIRFKKAA